MATKDEKGFTLLETLAAMGILSVLISIIAVLLSSSVLAVENSKNRLIFTARILKADAMIRNRVNSILIPYWETPSMETDGVSLTIPWYRGQRESLLKIRTDEDRLIMETDEGGKTETLTLIKDLEGVELSLLRNDYTMPWGIGVTYVYKQHIYHTRAAFSSIPLERGAP